MRCYALPSCHCHVGIWLPNRVWSTLSLWKNCLILLSDIFKALGKDNVVSLIYDNCFGSHRITCWRITGTDSLGKNVNVIILLIVLACVSSTCLKANVIEGCGFWAMANSAMWLTTEQNIMGGHVVENHLSFSSSCQSEVFSAFKYVTRVWKEELCKLSPWISTPNQILKHR
jgi:hypothetical protein